MENPLAVLAEWENVKNKAAQLAVKEKEMRQELFEHFFPDYTHEKGSIQYPLSEGYFLVGAQGVNRKLRSKQEYYEKKQENPVLIRKCFEEKPSLNKARYNKLEEREKRIINNLLIETPALPTLKIVAPKTKE